MGTFGEWWNIAMTFRTNAAVGMQVHQKLSQQDLARAQSVSKSPLCLDNPDTFGEEVAYWVDTENSGKFAP